MPSRCCISQLRSDAALSNVPADKAGAASGIYKMASSLGAALGVAISAAIFTALSGLEGELVPLSDVFLGRSDNIDIRLAGAVAPAALRDWRYLGISVVAGLVVFLSSPSPERQQRLRNLILTFDAAGLALFAVSGTQTALGYGLNPVMAALLGMLTGIGGGMLRDVLVSDIPAVLHSDLYAVAALAGALIVVAGHVLNAPPGASALAGAAVCFGIRVVALWRGWRLPIAGENKNAVGSADDAGARRDSP